MEIVNKLKLELKEVAKRDAKSFEEISNFIFMNPELSEQEYVSSAYLINYINSKGFTVESHYCGYETAFRAEFSLGNGIGPSIAFLAEYDALPVNRSKDSLGFKGEQIVEPGHLCGHNWIAAATTGVSACLSNLKGLNGKVVLIGTPAEETVGSKVDMVKAGVFDDIDVVIQPHLENFTDINCTALALDAIEFRFYGKATHAASYPHKGINALDAVQLMFSGVNALRQQLQEDVKICGIVVSGGDVSNIIPEYASCRFTIRAQKRGDLNEVTKRVINCARGAEMMTGARLEYDYFENQTDDILNVDLLQNILKNNMIEVGIEQIRDNMVMPTGSSDIGNVSQVCPTLYFELDIEANKPFYTHDTIALDYVNSMFAYRKLHQVILTMGYTAIDLFQDDSQVSAIKKRHLELRSMNHYIY